MNEFKIASYRERPRGILVTLTTGEHYYYPYSAIDDITFTESQGWQPLIDYLEDAKGRAIRV